MATPAPVSADRVNLGCDGSKLGQEVTYPPSLDANISAGIADVEDPLCGLSERCVPTVCIPSPKSRNEDSGSRDVLAAPHQHSRSHDKPDDLPAATSPSCDVSRLTRLPEGFSRGSEKDDEQTLFRTNTIPEGMTRKQWKLAGKKQRQEEIK